MPQGGQKSFKSDDTPMALKSVIPSLTALTIAVRSAQIVPPMLAFSMFAPVITSSSVVKRAAPTLKLE
jgi:hypothetical protein